MDTEYLREELGPCLSQCLAEVVMKRPYDPIEFIAYWLYKHADNVQRTKQYTEEKEELSRQRIVFQQEQELQRVLAEERRASRPAVDEPLADELAVDDATAREGAGETGDRVEGDPEAQTKVFGGSDDDTAPDGDPVEGDAADEAAEDAPQEDE